MNIRQKLVVIMNKIVRFSVQAVAWITTLSISGLLLSLTLRGEMGNPTPYEILTHLKDASKPFELSPERGRYALIMSIVDNNSYSFTTEIAKYVVPDLGYLNGKFVSLFAPGVSFIAMPFYILGKQYGISQVATFSVSSLFALVNVVLITLIVKKLTKNSWAGITAALTFLFGTSAWSYAVTLYQHHISTALLLMALYLLLFARNVIRTILVGVISAISFFVDYPNAVFFVPMLLLLLWRHVSIHDSQKHISLSVSYAVVFVVLGLIIGLLPFFWYNQQAYGKPFQLAGELQGVKIINEVTGLPELARSTSYRTKSALNFFRYERIPRNLDVLMTSDDRGMAVFSPVILLGLLGFWLLVRSHQEIFYTIVGTVLAILLLYGTWGDPWGGWAFGPRYMIPIMALLAVPLGAAIHTWGKRIWFLIPFIALLLYSVAISELGALTTNQIPPSVEIDSIMLPSPTYMHNALLLFAGVTGSFLYKTLFVYLVPIETYAVGIYVTTVMLVLGGFVLSTTRKKE